MQLYTIGHGVSATDSFIALLKKHGINVVVDVRSAPYSRYAVEYNKETLEETMERSGLGYMFMGDRLGGRPTDPALRTHDGRPDYSKIASSPQFSEGIDEILKLSEMFSVCLMCAEEDPYNCHRHHMIGKHLYKSHAVSVAHIRASGIIEEFTQLEGQMDMFG